MGLIKKQEQRITQQQHQTKQHFSHHHILTPLQPSYDGEQIHCKACDEQISDQFHGCLPCKFYLHDTCSDAPRSLNHPSHPSHPLALLPAPTYPSRVYGCNACGSLGKSYGFSCSNCEFDLHLKCADLPSTIIIDQHAHELKLVFDSSYRKTGCLFTCDACKVIVQSGNWVYYCRACDFGAHLQCAASKGCFGKDKSGEGREIGVGQSPIGGGGVGVNGRLRLESENDLFEAQRKLREERIAHQALDNAGDYVGSSSSSSYTTRYYYY